MGVKYDDRYCLVCDTYDQVERGRDTCPKCDSPLAEKNEEIEYANNNFSIHLPEIMAYKLVDALERIEVLESKLCKVDTCP